MKIIVNSKDRAKSDGKAVRSVVPTMYRTYYYIAKKWYTLRAYNAVRELERRKKQQRQIFERLSRNFKEKYYSLEDPNVYSAYITKFWASAIQEMANQLLPYPPFYFLRLPIFMFTMFSMKGYRLEDKLTFLRGKYSHEQLIELCQEDYAGMPILHVPSLLGSNNTITFVYLLTKYLQETGCDICGLENILEFGGGLREPRSIILQVRS